MLEWDETYYKRITRIEKEYEEKPFYEMLSSHCCRRAFCTNSFQAGIPVPTIMDLSGHDSEESFFKYIKRRSQSVEIYYDAMEAAYSF